ncbi:MAG TPA: peptidoglycan-binding domain-containing protein [Terriglobales bacterium]
MWAGFAGFLLEQSLVRWSIVVRGLQTNDLPNGHRLTTNDMFGFDQIRRWRRIGLCSLLCLAVHGLAIAQTASAQTETSSPPSQPAQAATAPAAKAENPASASATAKHTPTPSHTSSRTSSAQKKKSAHGKKVSKKRGQQVIDSERAREIQTALIREHYMEGQPSGAWDSVTQAAMQRYQADQGWQSKTTPDARALIKLGLGPNHDHLLNPESAMTSPTPSASDPKAPSKQTPARNNLPQQ